MCNVRNHDKRSNESRCAKARNEYNVICPQQDVNFRRWPCFFVLLLLLRIHPAFGSSAGLLCSAVIPALLPMPLIATPLTTECMQHDAKMLRMCGRQLNAWMSACLHACRKWGHGIDDVLVLHAWELAVHFVDVSFHSFLAHWYHRIASNGFFHPANAFLGTPSPTGACAFESSSRLHRRRTESRGLEMNAAHTSDIIIHR